MDPKSPYVVLPVGSKIPLMNTDTLNVSPEGAVQRCSIKKLFWKILQTSQRSTCAEVSFNELASLQLALLLQKRPYYWCFSWFWEIFEIAFLITQNQISFSLHFDFSVQNRFECKDILVHIILQVDLVLWFIACNIRRLMGSYRRVLKTLSYIKDGIFCRNCERFSSVNYFRKALHFRVFNMHLSCTRILVFTRL